MVSTQRYLTFQIIELLINEFYGCCVRSVEIIDLSVCIYIFLMEFKLAFKTLFVPYVAKF